MVQDDFANSFDSLLPSTIEPRKDEEQPPPPNCKPITIEEQREREREKEKEKEKEKERQREIYQHCPPHMQIHATHMRPTHKAPLIPESRLQMCLPPFQHNQAKHPQSHHLRSMASIYARTLQRAERRARLDCNSHKTC